MKTASRTFVWFLLAPALWWVQATYAEVYKCTGPDGKVSYVEAPCTGVGAKEAQVNITPSAPADAASTPGPDWKALNAAANARGQAAMATPNRGGSVRLPIWGKSQQSGSQVKTAQQITAECEANHGARCSSAVEINQRRMEQRTLTPDEEKARQAAVAIRREREQAEQEARWRALEQR